MKVRNLILAIIAAAALVASAQALAGDAPSRLDNEPINIELGQRPDLDARIPTSSDPSPTFRTGPTRYDNNLSCYDLGYSQGNRIVGPNPATGIYSFATGFEVYVESYIENNYLKYRYLVLNSVAETFPKEIRLGGLLSEGNSFLYNPPQGSDGNLFSTDASIVKYISFCLNVPATAVTVVGFQACKRLHGGTVLTWTVASEAGTVGYVVVRGTNGPRVGKMQIIGKAFYSVVDKNPVRSYTLKAVKIDGSLKELAITATS